MGKVKYYTSEQLLFVERYREQVSTVLAVKFNKKFGTKKTAMQLHSLRKRKGWKTGRTGRFEQGHSPHNTGTKGVMKANITSFKKGSRPANWKPVGSERIDLKDGYILIKTKEPRTWRLKHCVVWESIHGPIPADCVIRFLDNNRLNCAIENLKIMSRQEHLYLNRNEYSKTPAELQPTLMAVAKIEVKTFKLQKDFRKNKDTK